MSIAHQMWLKTAEKSSSTNFQVLQAPESWSKYTAIDSHCINIAILNSGQIELKMGSQCRKQMLITILFFQSKEIFPIKND